MFTVFPQVLNCVNTVKLFAVNNEYTFTGFIFIWAASNVRMCLGETHSRSVAGLGFEPLANHVSHPLMF